ncbi:MAG: alanine dehydrogenase [Clostridia bacterium]|nr:alanine dehydrogenase [Clostridia bacterium]
MIIGVLKEVKPDEHRVGAVANTVRELVGRGHTVYVEHDAGKIAGSSDEDYKAAGAIIADTETVYNKAELFYKVKELFPQEYKYMKEGKILVTYIHSNAHPEETDCLLESKCAAFAYEDFRDANGGFPLLRPASQIAGRGGFMAAMHFKQAMNGGDGQMLCNIPGIDTPVITIIGAGNSGMGAAIFAAALGNEVRIIDNSLKALEAAQLALPPNVTFLMSNRTNFIKCIKESDVIINCIMWDRTKNEPLVSRADLKTMKPNAMIVDVACDEPGAIETCRSTTHTHPTFVEEGILHYCVDNIASAFAKTASEMLSSATLPIVLEIAEKGVEKALKDNKYNLRSGLTCYKGKLTLAETAIKQNRVLTNVDELVESF